MDETLLTTPVGILGIAASDKGICRIQFLHLPEPPPHPNATKNPYLQLMEEELTGYFAGRLITFSCPIDLHGTDFQKRVWTRLSTIPFGTTRTYAQIAHEIGQPQASRAVGGANNRNPLPIVIPCHRVIGSNRKLVGFAGGLWRKQWMLEHEGISVSNDTSRAG